MRNFLPEGGEIKIKQERENLTGEELEKVFKEGVDYLRNLGASYHILVLESGKEGKMLVNHPHMGEFQVIIELQNGIEAYLIDDLEGLKEVRTPAKEAIHTEVLGELPPFPYGFIEFKTDLARLSLDYQEDKRGQKLLALKVIDKLRKGIS